MSSYFSILVVIVVLSLSRPSSTLSISFSPSSPRRTVAILKNQSSSSLLLNTSSNKKIQHFRGGDDNDESNNNEDYQEQVVLTATTEEQEQQPKLSSSSLSRLGLLTTTMSFMGNSYATSLQQYPILTKSITACLIFGLSDYLAQKVETKSSEEKKKAFVFNIRRAVASSIVGLCYFGPVSHYWYDMIFKILPGTSIYSTLQKAAMGQIFFGPSFTCIFFASALVQSKQFSIQNWMNKIRSDLPSAWLAGCGFWPLVDLVSYGFISPQYIPLFINIMSLVWNIYLSLVANKQQLLKKEKN